MHRFYMAPEEWNADALALSPTETHHCLHVLRAKRGDRVVVFNGRGMEATAEIGEPAGDRLMLRTLHRATSPRVRCAITLGQAVPKGKNMDLIVEKATELGAAAIAPLLSERTIVQCDAGEAERKQAKWHGVAIEAAKQCGQNWLPAVGRPQDLRQYFASGQQFDLMLIGSLQPDAQPIKAALAAAGAERSGSIKTALILIGPEGDFTPAEVGLARSHGCRPVTLGPIILRTETAAIYTLSVLSHELLQPGE